MQDGFLPRGDLTGRNGWYLDEIDWKAALILQHWQDGVPVQLRSHYQGQPTSPKTCGQTGPGRAVPQDENLRVKRSRLPNYRSAAARPVILSINKSQLFGAQHLTLSGTSNTE